MDIKQNQQRIKSLYKMLFEMATGNLAFRLEVDGCGDEIDNLATMLNTIAEKMQLVSIQPEFAKQLRKYRQGNNQNKHSDADFIQRVLNYIQNNIEEPLPSTKELSKMFSTNEFTLKDNFRKVLKTSIYQFYNEERLKKAHFLIENTPIPLKEIALMCGFNDYHNFYKSFKKKYTYTPSSIDRENDILEN